ncbi:MAG: 4Fe-4S binding protein [Eubacteriales bacterium]|nr:4Fe-4S binding protein [Eubacteriales bacterium]
MAVDYAALKAGGFMRQKQKDTFSMRLRVVGGTVTVKQLETIAAVAKKYGEDYVHLTSRQGVEIPFIKLEDIDSVKAELAEGGVQSGVCGPRVRTVTACQGGRCCPSGCIDALEIAVALDERYFGRQLPHKFKFGVTGCQNNCLKAEENDVGVKGGLTVAWNPDSCIFCGVCEKVCRGNAITITGDRIELDTDKCNHCGRCVKSCPSGAWEGKSGYILSFGGTFGNCIQKGAELLPIIEDEETLFRVTDAAVEFFAEFADRGERFAKTIERIGWDKLQERLEVAYRG